MTYPPVPLLRGGTADTWPPHEEPVVVLPWELFLDFMRDNWEPGWHIANIGPTGEGKSNLNIGLCSIRDYVLCLDAKGEDETLDRAGWVRVGRVPGERMPLMSADRRKWDRIWQDIADGKPARVIVGGPADTDAQDARLVELMRRAIAFARHSRGWTLYVDEFELLSSMRMYRLGPAIEKMLISARRAKTSVVTSYQAAAWVSKHATRQARMAVMYATGDRDMIKNVASSMGRDWRELAAGVDELPRFYVLVVPRGKNGGPMILTLPPKY